jgi:MATE family multidrug resistance protein
MTPSSSETQPLLPSVPHSAVEPEIEASSTSTSASAPQEGSAIKAELKLIFSLLIDSIPVILSYTLQNSIQTISIVITGRLGPHELSVAAFSLMLAFVTGELQFFFTRQQSDPSSPSNQ